jgi:hypothetical protein
VCSVQRFQGGVKTGSTQSPEQFAEDAPADLDVAPLGHGGP